MSYLDRKTLLLEEFVFSNYEPPPYAEWRPYDHTFKRCTELFKEWSPQERLRGLSELMRSFEESPDTLPHVHALAELICQDVAAEMNDKLSTRG